MLVHLKIFFRFWFNRTLLSRKRCSYKIITADDTKIIKTIQDEGCTYNIDTDTLLGEKIECAFSIRGNSNPLSAKAYCKSDLELQFLVSNTEKSQKTRIKTDQTMTCDAEHFYLNEFINVTLNGAEFFKESYNATIKRYFC